MAGKNESVEIKSQIWTAWAAVASVLLAATWADPDLGGHVRYGLDILRDHDLPLRDPYSFTQDRPWVNHEWLSEAAMAAAYVALGAPGLIVLKAALIVATLAVLFREFRHLSPLAGVTVLTLALLCAMSVTFTVRPQLWSMLALVLLVRIVARQPPPGAGQVVASGGLFALWANLHGGWIIGAGLLCAYALARVWRRPAEAGRWLALVMAALAATLINPYGVDLWGLLASTVRPSRPEITEWQPLGGGTSLMHWLPAFSLVLIWACLAWRERTRPAVEVSVALLVLLIGSLRALRIGPLVTPAALLILAPYIARAVGDAGRIRVPGKLQARVMWLPVLVVFAAVSRPVAALGQCIELRGPWVPDRQAAASLKGQSGRLWTTFSWGQYSNWQFGPALRVSIDGRLEVYSDDVRQLHRDFENGSEIARQRFQHLEPDFVWLPARHTGVRDWLAAHGYRIDIQTAESFIAVRAVLPRLSPARDPLPECFR